MVSNTSRATRFISVTQMTVKCPHPAPVCPGVYFVTGFLCGKLICSPFLCHPSSGQHLSPAQFLLAFFGCTCLMQAANSLSWPGLFHQQWLLYTCESSGNAPEILLEAKTAPRAGAEGEGSLGRAASRSGLLFLPWGFKSLVNKCLLCVLGEGKVPCSLPLMGWVVLGSCCPLGSRHGNLSLLGSSMVENGPTVPAGFK